jgi:hypothetical protein
MNKKTNTIFDAVLKAIQPAEELGADLSDSEYIELMENIGKECFNRASNCRLAEKRNMLKNLSKAQQLLELVYSYAIEHKNYSAEQALSCADTCITEAVDAIENFGGV